MNDLVAFWNRAELDIPPYRHPEDEISVARIHSEVVGFGGYRRAFAENALEDTKFHLNLLPQPYLGDIDRAEAIVLLLNPGLHATDFYIEENHPEFRMELIRSIRHERRTHLALDPTWAWWAGFQWWERKLRQTATLIAEQKFRGNYARTLEDMSRRIASIELIPYHSQNFCGDARLASCEAARKFVRSLSGSKTIIVTRKVREWEVQDLPRVVKYGLGQTRGASLGPTTPGGRALLSVYGI